MTNNLRYIERIPTAAEFQELRTNAGWGIPPESALKDSLAKTIFGVCVEDSDGTTIGMGRLVGDGGIQVFITDVIVHKHWQNRGIGKQIMKSLMKHVENVSSPATFVGLFSAIGREKFYKTFGFITRPNEKLGAGMVYFPAKKDGK
ncbi:putative acetyltransferase [Desulfosarcina cetonica]|uniref:GNAT family N-acetyltransferase n=1 Tax=Desulfosarcina cetonica TaxID=90730 RepID=UPI0006CFB3EE|nr:GNAT family N-acetyltransferase [Desulfosarcina cetonica]VTR67722.1 putative acetyltransferase [Desulfosarcina cetonica]